MRACFTLILLLGAAACGRSAAPGSCASDADCAADQRCAAGGSCAPRAAGSDGGVGGGAGGQPDGGGGAADGGVDSGGSDGGTTPGTDGGAGPAPGCQPGCAASQVCTAALTCADAYRVTILAPASGAVVSGFVTVQARVERAAAEVPLPTRVELRNSRNTPVLPMIPGAADGLATVYSFDFWTPERTEAPLTFTVAAMAPWGEVSQQVTVVVDTWAPRQLLGLIDCGGGECRPDSTLTIRQEIVDARLLGASASVELDGYARSFPFTPTGTGYTVSIPLRELPFPYYDRGVSVVLTARDAAGNVGTESLVISVGRFRWRRQLQVPITSPAVMKDGTLVLGSSRSFSQLIGLNQDGSDKWQLTLAAAYGAAAQFVTAPPSIGASAIWAGSEDGRVYAVDLAGAGILNGVAGGRGCDTGGAVRNAPSVGWQSPELAFAGSSTGSAFAADIAIKCAPTGPTGPMDAATAIDSVGQVFGWTTLGQLYRYAFGTTKFTEQQTATIGAGGIAPLAITSDGRIVAAGVDGTLNVSNSIPAANIVAATAPISSSPVIAANGDIIFGDDAGVLHRYTPAGLQVWPVEPNLGGAARAPLLLSGGDVEILVPTATGKLVGLKGDGTVLWSTDLAAGQDLREANIYTPPGQVGRAFSTALLGCGDGNLYAVMVDGQLDASAPWPRAHHDPQNTGNARGPRP
ncbi:MAG TPA: hypothetical protein VFE30_06680 [Anaeromyxobacteraceae bacterium]|jgi:hypothetical protein|nr:hypothetical protein [Anaeromyxobacteraceae bacterium]